MTSLQKFIKDFFKFLLNAWLFISKIIGSFFLGLIIVIIIIFSFLNHRFNKLKSETIEGGSEDKIALVRLSGEIVAENQESLTNFSAFGIDPKRTKRIFDNIKLDETIKAVIVIINSPGGSVVPSHEIYSQIRSLAKEKMVIAKLEEQAASGGYFIALGADYIVADPATLTGSLGVIMMSPNFEELFNKLGVKINTFKSGEYKDIGAIDRAMTDTEKEIMNSLVKDAYDLFISKIVESRKLDEVIVRQLADGRVYSGKQAVNLQLADKLANLDETIEIAKERANLKNPTIIEYEDYGFWEQLIKSSSKSFLSLGNIMQIKPRSGLYYLSNF